MNQSQDRQRPTYASGRPAAVLTGARCARTSQYPEPAGSLRPRGATMEERERHARMSTGAANAVRLALGAAFAERPEIQFGRRTRIQPASIAYRDCRLRVVSMHENGLCAWNRASNRFGYMVKVARIWRPERPAPQANPTSSRPLPTSMRWNAGPRRSPPGYGCWRLRNPATMLWLNRAITAYGPNNWPAIGAFALETIAMLPEFHGG
jgi:hypothetical protein